MKKTCYTCAKKKEKMIIEMTPAQDIETGRRYCQQCFKAGLNLQNYRIVELDKGKFKFSIFRNEDMLAGFMSRRQAEEVFYNIYCGKHR